MLYNNLKKIIKKIPPLWKFLTWFKDRLIILSRLTDVTMMMIMLHVWPEQTYRFSTRKLLPCKKNRFPKETKPIIPFDLLKIKSSDIPRMKEINDVIKPYQIFIKERYIDNINEPNTIFENYKYKKLTAKFSVEYYNLLSTHCIIGIYSSALARLAHDRRISLLNLFEYYDDSDRKQWKNYLDKLSNDIIYPNSIEELKELIVDAEK